MTWQLASIYRDLVPSRQLHRDTWSLIHLPGLAKTRHRDPPPDGSPTH